jgi:hypothetical protein
VSPLVRVAVVLDLLALAALGCAAPTVRRRRRSGDAALV